MTAAAELIRVEAAADDAIAAVRVSLCKGDEIFSALVRELGYGGSDQRLKVFCHRLQRHIERANG